MAVCIQARFAVPSQSPQPVQHMQRLRLTGKDPRATALHGHTKAVPDTICRVGSMQGGGRGNCCKGSSFTSTCNVYLYNLGERPSNDLNIA